MGRLIPDGLCVAVGFHELGLPDGIMFGYIDDGDRGASTGRALLAAGSAPNGTGDSFILGLPVGNLLGNPDLYRDGCMLG